VLSSLILQHFQHPLHRGRLDDYHGEGWAGSQGRYLRIQVRLVDNKIDQARFETQNCVPAVACGSALTDWALGKSLQELPTMDAPTLESLLGGLPEDRRDCAYLAIHALKRAVEDALQSERRPS
jgi:nitrogen fixation NifU-like protein